MSDAVRELEARGPGTVTLGALLDGSGIQFRAAVLGALLREGFELEETSPYLHHPLEILEAIDWLRSCGLGPAWEAFQQALHQAGRLGTLVDLGTEAPWSRTA